MRLSIQNGSLGARLFSYEFFFSAGSQHAGWRVVVLTEERRVILSQAALVYFYRIVYTTGSFFSGQRRCDGQRS